MTKKYEITFIKTTTTKVWADAVDYEEAAKIACMLASPASVEELQRIDNAPKEYSGWVPTRIAEFEPVGVKDIGPEPQPQS